MPGDAEGERRCRPLPQLRDLLRPCRRVVDAAPALLLFLLARADVRLKLPRILADIVVQAQEPPHLFLAESGGEASRQVGDARQMIAQKLRTPRLFIEMPQIGRRFRHLCSLPRKQPNVRTPRRRSHEDARRRGSAALPPETHVSFFDRHLPIPVCFLLSFKKSVCKDARSALRQGRRKPPRRIAAGGFLPHSLSPQAACRRASCARASRGRSDP